MIQSLSQPNGRVTLIISPWSITDFEGAGIEPRHMDHLGFKVETWIRLRKIFRLW